MVEIKRYIITNCISYTAVIILFTLIDLLGMEWNLSHGLVLKLFVLTSCIAALQFFTDKITEKNSLANIIVSLLDVFVIIFFVGGGILKVFQLNTLNTIVVGVMCLLVFISVYGVMVIRSQIDATTINKKLEEMRLNNNEGENKNE